MADKMSIEGPVQLERLDLDSSSRVAFDLMKTIAAEESQEQRSRDYYIKRIELIGRNQMLTEVAPKAHQPARWGITN